MTLWLLWDDVHVEVAGPENSVEYLRTFENVIKVLGGQPLPEGSDGFVRAWYEVAQDLRSVNGNVSPAFYRRFSTTFAEWIRAALEEKRVFRSETEIDDHPFSLFVQQRIATIGMFSEALFLELVCGFELPEEIYNHPTFRRLVELSGLLVGLSNEIVSVAKDVASVDSWSNLVLIHQRHHNLQSEIYNRCTIGDSFEKIVEMHDDGVYEYDRLASSKSLESFVPRDWQERVDTYLFTLRYSVRGFAAWHAKTKRYISTFVVDRDSRTAFIPAFIET